MDEADRADQEAEYFLAEAKRNRERKASLPTGEPGVCEWCGFDSKRLVRNACARCRDERGLA